MPIVPANGIELYHETFGDPTHPAVLLISGLGAQCTGYDDRLVDAIAAADTFVVRFDNRDVGLSTHVEPGTGYELADFVADALALLDALGIDRAHVVGASMGGMIAQQLAIDAPERVLSLTSIMSTTGEAAVGNSDPEILGSLMELSSPAEGRDAAIAKGMELARLIGSPDFDEDYHRTRQTSFYDRYYDPAGVGRQLTAIVGAPDRAAGLAGLDLPCVVVHGSADPLIDPSGGRRTAELVPGARFVEVDGMGHDLPQRHWPLLVELIGEQVAAASERI
jgi:pimeloyl-ACP methyl ester carboxylesterase